MMRRMGRLVAFVLLLMVMGNVVTASQDFANNEQHYMDMCSKKITSDQKQICKSFQRYLDQKYRDQANKLSQIESNLKETQGSLFKNRKEAQSIEAQIKEAHNSILLLEEQLVHFQDEIVSLEEDIKTTNVRKEASQDAIKARMVLRQGDMHVNQTLTFVLGGRSYTEMMRRMSAVESINRHDQEQIQFLTNLIHELDEKKEALTQQVARLTEDRATMSQLQASYQATKKTFDDLVVQYSGQESLLLEQQNQAAGEKNNLEQGRKNVQASIRQIEQWEAQQRRIAQNQQVQVGNVAGIDTFNGGWSYPVSNFWVSAGAWYYPGGGGVHYGVDMATNVGTPITSTGPGYVVNAWQGCDTYGYLGNTCGYQNNWGGNQVTTIVTMNGKLYGLNYMHLEQVYVSNGQRIDFGTQLGTVGSSGNSSGPHLHHEVIYLGTDPIDVYMANWNGYLTFTPTGEWMDLNWTCDARGGVPPCRENPQLWYGLEVGASY